jgi:hypothetical protein
MQGACVEYAIHWLSNHNWSGEGARSPSAAQPSGMGLREVWPGEGRNLFSNRWKTGEKFFQSLEKRDEFSNHWKKSFQSLEKPGEDGG